MNMQKQFEELAKRISNAMDVISTYGSIDGAHHKQWCLDQVARALLPDDSYKLWADHYDWDEGIAP